MSKWDKLLAKICRMDSDVRFEELKRILESYGYEMRAPRGGSSHFVFRKEGHSPITIPKHKPMKRVYVEMVRQVVEEEEK